MKIIVDNCIKVENPTGAVLNFCKKALVFDNPDYYKKERLGKWVGNTPKQLYLYEKKGDTLVIPFGCLRDVWHLCPNADWDIKILPIKGIEYGQGINLYSYQENAVESVLRVKNGVLVMPCGSGKTNCGLEVVRRVGGKALWLTHTQDLLTQSMLRAKNIFDLPDECYGTITAGRVSIGTHITFATVQTMCRIDLQKYKNDWDVVVVDECMPGNTLIDTPKGKKYLQFLHIDDVITSYNRKTGETENKRVTHIFKHKAHDIVKVTLSNGDTIVCTKNHPIYTTPGIWLDAGRLMQNDYVLRLVWKRSRNRCNAEIYEEQSLKKRILLLFQRMLNKRRSQKRCVDRGAQAQGSKRPIFEWVRVDSVEVQKQTSDGTFGGLCPDGFVYNIEVEDNNNYFANGVLVHNCQHLVGSPTKVTQFYKVVSSLSARYKIGLTATPKRADGLERSMFALLGGIIHTVSREAVAEYTCKVIVKSIETGYIPDVNNITQGDGTLDYMALIDDLIGNENRFKKVLETIEQLDGSAIVLANRVAYLQRLNDEYSRRSVCLSGAGYTKKAKAERKAALDKLRYGDIDVVFSTYALASEGLDVPNLRYVVFTTPEKNETCVVQAVGRVGRKADGKEYGTVIDFVDDFPMYRKWYKTRIGYYKKIEAEVVE